MTTAGPLMIAGGALCCRIAGRAGSERFVRVRQHNPDLMLLDGGEAEETVVVEHVSLANLFAHHHANGFGPPNPAAGSGTCCFGMGSGTR